MIKATDALAKLSAELDSQYKRAESIIDRQIEKMTDDEAVADLGALEGSVSPRVLRRLEQAYRDGGWVVTVQPVDGRGEGPFFRLRVASPPRSGPGST